MCVNPSDLMLNLDPEKEDSLSPASLDNPFWQTSLTLYAHQDVAHLCLTLQDEHQMQVNLLLYSIWLSFEGCILEPWRIKQNQQLHTWLHRIIPAIRHARQIVGENSKQEPLYKQLKANELAAEQKAQALLFALPRQKSPTAKKDDLASTPNKTLIHENLSLCWQAFAPKAEKNQPCPLIKQLSEWMIQHCQRKIADKFER